MNFPFLQKMPRFWLIMIILFLGCSVIMIGYYLWLSPQRQLKTIFANNSNCIDPCWQGVKPGDSTKVDVNELRDRNRLTFLFSRQIDYAYQQLLQYDSKWEWFNLRSGLHTSIQIKEEDVTTISFSSKKFTLGSVLDELGSPDYYTAARLDFDLSIMYIDLIYQTKGVVVHSETEIGSPPGDGCNQQLDLNWPVEAIYLVEPNMSSPYTMWIKTTNAPVWNEADVIQEWDNNNIINFVPPCRLK